jgi:hypothetical protein
MTPTKGFPYLQFETFTLRQRHDLENMRDVRDILRMEEKEMQDIMKELDATALDGLNEGMKNDIVWRAEHLGAQPHYWELVTPDFPRQLTSGRSNLVDPTASKYAIVDVDKQALSRFPFYKDAQLIRYSFRAFHRKDGELISPRTCTDITQLF